MRSGLLLMRLKVLPPRYLRSLVWVRRSLSTDGPCNWSSNHSSSLCPSTQTGTMSIYTTEFQRVYTSVTLGFKHEMYRGGTGCGRYLDFQITRSSSCLGVILLPSRWIVDLNVKWMLILVNWRKFEWFGHREGGLDRSRLSSSLIR